MSYLPSTAWFVLLITLDQQKVHFKIFRVSFSSRLLFQVFSLFGEIFALTLPHWVKNDRKVKRRFDVDLTADSMPSYISKRSLLFMQTVSLRLYWHHHRTVLYSAWCLQCTQNIFWKKKKKNPGVKKQEACQMHKDELWQQKVAEKRCSRQMLHLPPQLAPFSVPKKQRHMQLVDRFLPLESPTPLWPRAGCVEAQCGAAGWTKDAGAALRTRLCVPGHICVVVMWSLMKGCFLQAAGSYLLQNGPQHR